MIVIAMYWQGRIIDIQVEKRKMLSALTAETEAIRKSLVLAKANDWKQIAVETESGGVKQKIEN